MNPETRHVSCAAEHGRRLDNQERYDEIYDRERKEYIAKPDWADVAAHCPDEIPVLMAMIARGKLGLAELFLNNTMLTKAADSHADVCATNGSSPSTW